MLSQCIELHIFDELYPHAAHHFNPHESKNHKPYYSEDKQNSFILNAYNQ